MTICYDSFSVPSSLAKTQDFDACAPAQARKARPLGLIISHIDSNAVSPDFDCRSISPVSDGSESPQSSDDGTASSSIVGFGRKRHSILPTLSPFPDGSERSTIVGFGRKPNPNRLSIAAAPSSSASSQRKQENRRSLPNPIIPRDPVDPKPRRRFSLDLSRKQIGVPARPASVFGIARRVSDTILGNTNRQPPKPLILPQLVEARSSLPARVKRCLVVQVASVASSPRVKSLVSRFSVVHRLRLKPLNVGRQSKEKTSENATLYGLFELLIYLFYRRLCEILGF
ncbi:hypothetical protein B0H17DRAFT_489495 [Mycena rosella]|uniref:Uncharacterized protein n=1 Tax=Mycena rosella TaxID=1033263 RepID=A0AAD7DK19_MYCRO|nr:hypothetical protein B0H17DRAFT_489495 [Mycena rosella]